MRNTLLLQLPGVRKICLYYIAAPVLLLCLFLGTACPAYAEETVDSSSSSTSDTTDDDLSLGGDITDAYDKYAGGVDSGLDDIKEQYDGVVNDSVLRGRVYRVDSCRRLGSCRAFRWFSGRAGHCIVAKGVSVWNNSPLSLPLFSGCSNINLHCTASRSVTGTCWSGA